MTDPSNSAHADGQSHATQTPTPPASAPGAAPTVSIAVDEKTYIILMHVSAVAVCFLGPIAFVVPLIMWLIKKDASSAIDAHGKAAVNFQISLAIYWIVAAALVIVIVGYFLILLVLLLGIIGGVLGAVKASNGELFKYPLSLRLIT